MVVCRGCCCGDAAKHPDVDHADHLRRLSASSASAAGPPARVRVSDCLGPCTQANVVVVTPAPAARRRGARPVWLGLVNDDGAVELLDSWLRAGGPGAAPLPAPLHLHRFDPPPRSTRVR
ncbi:MAG TPA: hypothetical protein VNV66_06180 [Pilimelia sp.]|nr:hypothetical protein [Pilimelia sp.]